MSSSDSDFEVGENSCFGYQYEPEYTEEELAAAAATNEESTNNEEDEAIDKNLCSCGHCARLPKQRECLCCKQFQRYDEHYITEDMPCISLHPDFDIICLDNTVLETVYPIFSFKKDIQKANIFTLSLITNFIFTCLSTTYFYTFK
jgi:hypothetical protein